MLKDWKLVVSKKNVRVWQNKNNKEDFVKYSHPFKNLHIFEVFTDGSRTPLFEREFKTKAEAMRHTTKYMGNRTQV